MKNVARGKINTAQGEAECFICLQIPPECCIFHTAQG